MARRYERDDSRASSSANSLSWWFLAGSAFLFGAAIWIANPPVGSSRGAVQEPLPGSLAAQRASREPSAILAELERKIPAARRPLILFPYDERSLAQKRAIAVLRNRGWSWLVEHLFLANQLGAISTLREADAVNDLTLPAATTLQPGVPVALTVAGEAVVGPLPSAAPTWQRFLELLRDEASFSDYRERLVDRLPPLVASEFADRQRSAFILFSEVCLTCPSGQTLTEILKDPGPRSALPLLLIPEELKTLMSLPSVSEMPIVWYRPDHRPLAHWLIDAAVVGLQLPLRSAWAAGESTPTNAER